MTHSTHRVVPSPSNFLIIEAKQSDLTKGFTQLAVELIALDHWVESESPILYGVVSTGEIWRFGLYDRAAHHVVELFTTASGTAGFGVCNADNYWDFT